MRWLAAAGRPVALSLIVIAVLSLVLDLNRLSTYTGGMLVGVVAAGVLVAGMVARDTLGETNGMLSRALSNRVMIAIGNARFDPSLGELHGVGIDAHVPGHLAVDSAEPRLYFGLR